MALITFNLVLLSIGFIDGSNYDAKTIVNQIDRSDSDKYNLADFDFQISAYNRFDEEYNSFLAQEIELEGTEISQIRPHLNEF